MEEATEQLRERASALEQNRLIYSVGEHRGKEKEKREPPYSSKRRKRGDPGKRGLPWTRW